MKPFQSLRWKLTLNYMLVTVATWLVIEIAIIGGASYLLIYSNLMPAFLVSAIDGFIVPQVASFLQQPQPDVGSLTAWMEAAFAEGITFTSPENPRISFHLGDLDQNAVLIVLDETLEQVAGVPASYDFQSITGNQEVINLLVAAQGGQKAPDKITNVSGGYLQTAVPVFDGGGKLTGIVLMVITYPPPGSLTQMLSLLGVSVIIFALAAGLVGAVFGIFTARGLTRRLERISTAANSWSEGDFSAFIKDRSRDELSQLAQQLNRMAEQLQQLLQTKQDLATLEERNRLARDLHDSVKQQVFAATMQIGAARTMLSQDINTARMHLAEAEQLSHQAQSELAALIQELRPISLSDRGLIPAFEEYFSGWSRQSNIEVSFSAAGEGSLPPSLEQVLFRVTQEALSNTSRHSEASRVEIQLDWDDEEVFLKISDNGIGFDLHAAEDRGMGLRSMRERVESVGGNFVIESGPGQGTVLTVRCALDERADHGR